jgi:hypothetical protein
MSHEFFLLSQILFISLLDHELPHFSLSLTLLFLLLLLSYEKLLISKFPESSVFLVLLPLQFFFLRLLHNLGISTHLNQSVLLLLSHALLFFNLSRLLISLSDLVLQYLLLLILLGVQLRNLSIDHLLTLS